MGGHPFVEEGWQIRKQCPARDCDLRVDIGHGAYVSCSQR